MNYKGIAIFGAPGSGKTTAARLLLKAFQGAQHLEASQAVIYPAATLKDQLPASEREFIKTISSMRSRRKGNDISRGQARDFFILLKEKYSPAVIAKTLVRLHEQNFSKKFMILAGIRGYANSLYFKKNGYLVLYLTTPEKQRARRLAKREKYSRKTAEKERDIEERIFSTNMVEKIAHLSFNTAEITEQEIVGRVRALVAPTECRRCVNNSINPYVLIGRSGLCDVCEKYEKYFTASRLKKELKTVLSLRGTGRKKHDALVGISGGKDSTATLYEVMNMGFRPLAFSLDSGYYPKHIFARAAQVARQLGVEHKVFDIRRYMRPADRVSFERTAELYDEQATEELREKFRKWYGEGRRHYSVKCRHAIPFVRTCQLCRRLTIRAYYDQAVAHGVSVVILGINEWAGLSQDSGSKRFIFSAIRKLKPYRNRPAVFVVHLPFLLQRRIGDTRRILKKLGWKIPQGEELIESNSNSCLFARAAESKARQMLGFHPDMTRLAREVTVGFISKEQARRALAKIHRPGVSVRAVLKKARCLR